MKSTNSMSSIKHTGDVVNAALCFRDYSYLDYFQQPVRGWSINSRSLQTTCTTVHNIYGTCVAPERPSSEEILDPGCNDSIFLRTIYNTTLELSLAWYVPNMRDRVSLLVRNYIIISSEGILWSKIQKPPKLCWRYWFFVFF